MAASVIATKTTDAKPSPHARTYSPCLPTTQSASSTFSKCKNIDLSI